MLFRLSSLLAGDRGPPTKGKYAGERKPNGGWGDALLLEPEGVRVQRCAQRLPEGAVLLNNANPK